MLLVFAVAAILSTDSVDINTIDRLPDLDSVLTTHQVVVTDVPTIIIQSGDVSADSLADAFAFARLYYRGHPEEAKKIPGYEHSLIVAEDLANPKAHVYVLLYHDDGNLPEIIFRKTGELGVMTLTYITSKGMAIAVAKL